MGNQTATITLVMNSGPTPGKVLTIQGQAQIIGRGEGSHIHIPDKALSRQHARVWATPQGLVVEDMGSTNGTFANGQRISSPVRLSRGDTLQLGGEVSLTVQAVSAGDDDTVLESAPAGFDQTVVPRTPAAPVQSTSAPAKNNTVWVWAILIILFMVIIVAGILAYLFFLQSSPTPPIQANLPPTATVTPVPVDTPPPTEPPTATAATTPTSEPIQVPGLLGAAAMQQTISADAINKVDPFCGKTIEVAADEPVFIVWQRRLAPADGTTDYVADWLIAAQYDLTLDGRPVPNLSYQKEADGTLTWWANLGLLPPGEHYARMQWYTNRPVTNGLDIDPADGQMDSFGPGPVGEGFCEIVVPEVVVAAEASPTPTATTPAATPTPTSPPAQTANTLPPAPLGIFENFETPSTWKRGDQPYGEFIRSSSQVYSGSYAGQLSYNFPTPDNDYVVFLHTRQLAGQPNAISAWVYGDGSGHFLNVWIKDNNGQIWGMNFGQVNHTGWQEMTAYIDPSQPWPSGHISGPNNNVIDYPISFQGLVLDDGSDSYIGSGTIYLDDLNSQEGSIPPTPQITAPTTPGGNTQPSGPARSTIYALSIGNQHRYEEPWGAPVGSPCDAYRNNAWDNKNPNFRGFNVEMLLTNNSSNKVQDDWGEGMRFFTNRGDEVTACYYGYDGAGPPPKGTTSLTFFSVIPQGTFVQLMQLNLNGEFLQICLDGSGGWSPC
jgi:hypothetical protein